LGDVCEGTGSPQVVVERFVSELPDGWSAIRPERQPAGEGCRRWFVDVGDESLGDVIVGVNVTSVAARSAETLASWEMGEWRGWTDGDARTDRSRAVEEALHGRDGFEDALVAGRCSDVEATCIYVVAVDSWLLSLQVLRPGSVAADPERVVAVDDFVVEIADQLAAAIEGEGAV
jgi:hypothetical protein